MNSDSASNTTGSTRVMLISKSELSEVRSAHSLNVELATSLSISMHHLSCVIGDGVQVVTIPGLHSSPNSHVYSIIRKIVPAREGWGRFFSSERPYWKHHYNQNTPKVVKLLWLIQTK